MHKTHLLVAVFLLSLLSCGNRQESSENSTELTENKSTKALIPEFRADSAYAFIQKQLDFGPRVPNTQAHREAGEWLSSMMHKYADTVYIQQGRVRAWDGNTLNIKNIIGVFKPEERRRILLCAHWDSRPFADHDPDPGKHYTPIDGANDGASSVGVLLEIARLLSMEEPGIGVDIILFDAEDYGIHRLENRSDEDTWALGSQYWARNPHRSDYNARYGILLDMVGASGATFKREGYSMLYAPNIVRQVWDTARRLGHSHMFLNRDGGYIIDDHYYINTIRNIPTINIIHQDETTPHGFFPEWHTTDDTIDVIDISTLRVVGETVVNVIYNE